VSGDGGRGTGDAAPDGPTHKSMRSLDSGRLVKIAHRDCPAPCQNLAKRRGGSATDFATQLSGTGWQTQGHPELQKPPGAGHEAPCAVLGGLDRVPRFGTCMPTSAHHAEPLLS
jgi:hypothetical protein